MLIIKNLPIQWGCIWKNLTGNLNGGNLISPPYKDRPGLWPVRLGYPGPYVCNEMCHPLRCKTIKGPLWTGGAENITLS